MSEVKEHVLRQLRRIPVKNSMCSPSGSESPHREGSKASEASREVAPPALPGQHVFIDYTNWRGERSMRRIVPNMESLWYGFNDWHKEAQWLLDAYDVEKGDTRTFAMKDIHSWRSVSDGDRNGEDPKGLSGEAMLARSAQAETPFHPSPSGEVEKVIERLRDIRKGQILQDGSYLSVADLCKEGARLLTTYAEDNERLRKALMCPPSMPEASPRESTMAVEHDRDVAPPDIVDRLRQWDANSQFGKPLLLEAADIIEACSETIEGQSQDIGALVKERDTALSQAEEMRKALEEAAEIIGDLMETGFNVADTPTRQRARAFLIDRTALMKGGE